MTDIINLDERRKMRPARPVITRTKSCEVIYHPNAVPEGISEQYFRDRAVKKDDLDALLSAIYGPPKNY